MLTFVVLMETIQRVPGVVFSTFLQAEAECEALALSLVWRNPYGSNVAPPGCPTIAEIHSAEEVLPEHRAAALERIREASSAGSLGCRHVVALLQPGSSQSHVPDSIMYSHLGRLLHQAWFSILGGLGFDVVTRSAPASDGNSPTVVFLDIIDTAKKVGRPYLDSDDDDDSDDDEPETEDEDAEMVEHAQGEGGASDGGPRLRRPKLYKQNMRLRIKTPRAIFKGAAHFQSFLSSLPESELDKPIFISTFALAWVPVLALLRPLSLTPDAKPLDEAELDRLSRLGIACFTLLDEYGRPHVVVLRNLAPMGGLSHSAGAKFVREQAERVAVSSVLLSLGMDEFVQKAKSEGASAAEAVIELAKEVGGETVLGDQLLETRADLALYIIYALRGGRGGAAPMTAEILGAMLRDKYGLEASKEVVVTLLASNYRAREHPHEFIVASHKRVLTPAVPVLLESLEDEFIVALDHQKNRSAVMRFRPVAVVIVEPEPNEGQLGRIFTCALASVSHPTSLHSDAFTAMSTLDCQVQLIVARTLGSVIPARQKSLRVGLSILPSGILGVRLIEDKTVDNLLITLNGDRASFIPSDIALTLLGKPTAMSPDVPWTYKQLQEHLFRVHRVNGIKRFSAQQCLHISTESKIAQSSVRQVIGHLNQKKTIRPWIRDLEAVQSTLLPVDDPQFRTGGGTSAFNLASPSSASVFGTAHRAVLESAIVTKVKSWAAGRASRDSARAREVAAQDVAQRSLVLNQERAQRARRALSGEEGIEIE